VANVSLLLALDRQLLEERVGMISERQLDQLLIGVDMVLGRI
jgi:hypothetical protein